VRKLINKFLILGVASVWSRRKGLEYFIDISNKLKEDEVIVLVGLSDKQLKEIPSNIIGISQTNNINELVEIYSSADVFLNPTLEDNFPSTNLEALACGTPVITFDTGGSPEAIDEKTGLIVKKANKEDLLNKIKWLKIEKTKFTSESCVERAVGFYCKDFQFMEYVRLYKLISYK